MTQPRAYIRQPSGLHLDLLTPNPSAWTDNDLAISLARTPRWGGHSIHSLPLSVAQHSLTVLAIAATTANKVGRPLSQSHSRRELLHDADEALIGCFDPISPLKPFLGQAFIDLTTRLQQAIAIRYDLPAWSPEEHAAHKHADILAAASEAVHVAGWSHTEVREILQIKLTPLTIDPLTEIYDCAPWRPWPCDLAADRFLAMLTTTQNELNQCDFDCRWCNNDSTTCKMPKKEKTCLHY